MTRFLTSLKSLRIDIMAHSKQDPTGQAKNRKRAYNVIEKRITTSEKAIKGIFKKIKAIPSKQTVIINKGSQLTNEKETIYNYEISPQDLVSLNDSILYILNNELLETQNETIPLRWYWKDQIEQPARQGAIEEIRDFSQEIAIAASLGFFAGKIRPEVPEVGQVLFSDTYRNQLELSYLDNFVAIKGLSDDTAKHVYRVIKDGISSGLKPAEISRQITERFNVSKSGAKRITNTSINSAYNNSRLAMTKELEKQTNTRAGVIHVSALLQTTRSWHAERHGNAYTVEAQLQWWSEDGNRINCHCTTRSILVNDIGEVVNTDLKESLEKEKDFFK